MKYLYLLLFLPALVYAGWVSPTANNNPGTWSDPTNAYDGDTLTYSGRSGVPSVSLILYRTTAVNCDSIKFKGAATNSKVEVYYSGAYHTVLNGAWSGVFTVYPVNAGSYEDVDSVKFTNNDMSTLYEMYYLTAGGGSTADTTKLGGTGTDTLKIGGTGIDTVKVGS